MLHLLAILKLVFILTIYTSVCQIATSTGIPAGSKDTSFSVDTSGNVVISYGVIESGQPIHGRQVNNFNVVLYQCN